MDGPSQELLDKITKARSIDGSSGSALPYRNIGEMLLERADRLEDLPFLIYYGEEVLRKEFSFRDIYEQACRTANYLRSVGIRRGDRIAVVSANHPDTVTEYFAAFMMGAVAVPVNPGEDDRHVQYILQNSGARLAFVRDMSPERIAAIAGSGFLTIARTGQQVDDESPNAGREIAKQSATFAPEEAPDSDDDALIVYTSGATGKAKGVVLTQRNLLVEAMSIAAWHQLADDQRMMCVLPLYHVNGIVVTLLTPLLAGAGVVLNQQFHSDRFFERASAERVSVVSVVPTLLKFLLSARIDLEGYKLAQFRHVICGAGPLSAELAQKFEQTFKIPVIHGYGLSETTSYCCFLPIDLSPAQHRAWLTRHDVPSIGVPLPVNEMAIHDPEGNDLPEGVKGEIVIRGENVMRGYLDDVEANSAAFTHGWFRSGDEGYWKMDDEGRRFFFVTGRIKELIIRGGSNISPFEIDEVLGQIPGVEAGIAVGFENDWYGEEVGAYVKLKAGIQLTERDVLDRCRRKLPYVKSPKVVVFGTDIPVTPTGVYERGSLKPLFSGWKETQFTEKK